MRTQTSNRQLSNKQGDTVTITIENKEGNPLHVLHPKISGPDNLYINIAVKGGNAGNQSQPHKTFTFSQYFPEPILKEVQNHYLSIVSLASSATEVPFMS